MEKMSNEESPSLTKLYEELVFSNEEVLKANVQRMSNAQLIEFYEYCVEKSEDALVNGCELYWYATLVLEEMPAVRMYKNGQLYIDTTLGNNEVPYMESIEVTEDDISEINSIVELLEQRKIR